MLSKINYKRVALTGALIFAVAFATTAAALPNAVGQADWSTAKDLAMAGILAGLAAIAEAVLHLFTPGQGDPTA